MNGREMDVSKLLARIDDIERRRAGLAGRGPTVIATAEVRRLLTTTVHIDPSAISSNGHRPVHHEHHGVIERRLQRSWAELPTRERDQRPITTVRHWILPGAVLTTIHFLISWAAPLWS